MSIYVVKPAQFGSKVPSFVDRDLNAFTSAKISDASIFIFGNPTSAWESRKANVASDLNALIEGKALFDTVDMKNLLSVFKGKHFATAAPIVSVDTGKSDAKSVINLGFIKSNDRSTIYVHTPSEDAMKYLTQLEYNPMDNPAPGTTSIAGMTAFYYAWRGIAAFKILFNDKTAVADRLFMSEAVYKTLMDVAKEGEAPKYRGYFNSTSVSRVSGFGKSSRAIGEDHHCKCDDKTLIKAGESGFLFPFFREMLDSDPDTPFDIFMSIFKSCIAGTPQSFAQIVPMLRKGFRHLSSTLAGKVIQHIYFGIKLSLESGLIMDTILDGGKYVGFMLRGPAVILARGSMVPPMEHEALQKAVEGLGRHRATIQKIAEMLYVIPLIGAAQHAIDLAVCAKNPRALLQEFLKRPVSAIEEKRKEFGELIDLLTFDQEWVSKNEVEIVNCFRDIVSGSSDINTPLYDSKDVILSRDNILHALARFGPQAPTIFFGTKVVHISAPGAPDPNLIKQGDPPRNVLPYVPVSYTGLYNAAEKWKQVRSARAIKFPPAKKGAAGTVADRKACSTLITGAQFEAFYPMLKEWVHANVQSEAPKVGDKRKKDVDMAEAPVVKKRFVFDEE